MKTTLLAVAAFVAFLIIGCADNPNPVQPDTQSASVTPSKGGLDDLNGDRGGNKANRVKGRINGIDVVAGTVTIGTRIVRTNSSTKIERNGIRVPLAAFRVGDRGQARLVTNSMLATKVEATTPAQ
jgi:uncharacterized lipoprotein YehR (DUF1307 family)